LGLFFLERDKHCAIYTCSSAGYKFMDGSRINLMNFLRHHPFPILAKFERVVAVSFAFPEATLRPLVPVGLEVDCYRGYGFITAALVWTRHLRPVGFPAFLGQDFFLAGYRIFTRLRDGSGRNLRGLKIIRSETDKQGMVVLGNLMTGYNYRKVLLRIEKNNTDTHVHTSLVKGKTTLDLTFDESTRDAELPIGSPFSDWRTARRFSGPMPFTFSSEGDGRFVVVQGKRADWIPRPVRVRKWVVGLFDEGSLRGVKPILANAFMVENVEYRWDKGRVMQLRGAL
jgi:hypothetical protein